MTGVDLDATRDELAELLHVAGTRPGFTELDAWTRWTTLADALLPVVDRIAKERAAAELWAAANYWDRPTVRTIAHDLRIRAHALNNKLIRNLPDLNERNT